MEQEVGQYSCHCPKPRDEKPEPRKLLGEGQGSEAGPWVEEAANGPPSSLGLYSGNPFPGLASASRGASSQITSL